MKKRIFVVVLTLVFLLSIASAFAGDKLQPTLFNQAKQISQAAIEKVEAFINPNIVVKTDDEIYDAEQENGEFLPPVIYKDRTYLPVSAISEMLGVEVQWDEKTKTVTIKADKNKGNNNLVGKWHEENGRALMELTQDGKLYDSGQFVATYELLDNNQVKITNVRNDVTTKEHVISYELDGNILKWGTNFNVYQTFYSFADLSYEITKENLEIKAKNSTLSYPKMKGYSGELLQDYMNQSLKKITDLYGYKDLYTNVKIDYEITKMDNDILSILFKGTGEMIDYGKINIQHSVNLDIKSTNEITYDNYIKNDQESKEKVMNILDSKAKESGLAGLEAEGISVYFKGENVVFYYMPLDDSASEFIELSVSQEELEGCLNTDFGEIPAS